MKSSAEGISRQLRGWANSLQNSEIPGQRHLNDQTKRSYDNRNRADNFRKQIQTNVEQAQQQREQEQRKSSSSQPPEDPSD